MTDLAYKGSFPAPEIMLTSHNQFHQRSRLAHGFRDNAPLLFSIIEQST